MEFIPVDVYRDNELLLENVMFVIVPRIGERIQLQHTLFEVDMVTYVPKNSIENKIPRLDVHLVH